jgi:membrane protease YdiL (CAAX protease family)
MTAWELTGTVFKISAVLAIFFIVVRREKRSVKSIGWRSPRLKDVVLGVAAFLAVQELSRVTWSLALIVMPKAVADMRAGAALYASLPLSLNVLGAISNGAAEEVGYRGYALERLSEITGSTWLGAGIPYFVEVLCHAPIWGFHGMLLQAPPLLIFVLLYLWQRSLPACILGHLLCDVIPIFR